MTRPVSRRTFLKSVSAASLAGPFIFPKLSLAAPPSSRLQHASIGVGGQAAYDLGMIYSSEKVDVVALCDIDKNNLDKAAQQYPNARLYRDWREMLEAEEDHIDSVNVGTPDHTHAPASMTAIQKGKHVFCEKPLTHDVYEARQVRLASHKKGVVTQMGNQIHSHEFYRTAVHWVKEGAIGKVKEWHSWSAAVFTTEDKKRPQGWDVVPPTVEWDLWLGTAPVRPYKAEAYHPFWWRRWRDFGGGAVGDFGCHIFDPVYSALDIGQPTQIKCEAECVSEEVYPLWIIADYLFPGTALTSGKTIAATWRDGGKKPDVSLSPHIPAGYELPNSGSILIGEDGTLLIPHVAEPKLFPEEKFASYPKPELEPKNHYHEFVDACLGSGIKPGSNFDFAGPMAEAVLLANVANRFPGETLEWNADKLKFTNNSDANKYLRRKYRKGWKVRGL
ncbi:MAG: dehydrogenase [Candidatus Hydrogenedentota bacterium]